MDTINRASNGRSSSFLGQYQLIIFFVLVLAQSAGVAGVAVMIGDANIAILSVLTPSLTAIVLTALVSGKAGLRELLVKQTIQRVSFPWIVISLITIPLIAAVAIWHFPGYLIGVGTPEQMPFYVFMLWVLAATILITWVYNNTRSVLMAILMHTAANATFGYLRLTPRPAGQITTFWLFLGLLWLVTVAVIIVFGPTHLIRKPASELET